MPVATVTIYAKSVAWNSITWDSTSGGPVRVEYSHSGDALEDRTGDSDYAPFLAVVNKKCKARVTLREIKQVAALGAKSNLVITATGKANTVTITLANMILVAVESGEQHRAAAGSATLVFQHESADGSTVPVS